jgi:hypothetical protein
MAAVTECGGPRHFSNTSAQTAAGRFTIDRAMEVLKRPSGG